MDNERLKGEGRRSSTPILHHAFDFYGMLSRQFECVSAYTITCCSEKKLVFYSSRASLVLFHRLQMDGRLCAPRRELNQKLGVGVPGSAGALSRACDDYVTTRSQEQSRILITL